jgi:hypothetical protein
MVKLHHRILIIGLTAAAMLALVLSVDTGLAGGGKTTTKTTKAHKIDPNALDEEAQRVLHLVHKNAKYPINNYDALAAAMGGHEAHVKIGEQKMKVAELKAHIPASVFPIKNVDDLHVKMSHLRANVPHGKVHVASIKIPAGEKHPEGKPPPAPKHATYHGIKKKTTTSTTTK